ncbi:hypothetical protein TNCV_1471831 [Trichonephila clavipes]|nr:hypothetical protein TNCV_1471831 [Trichonephila clavipes]
MRIVTPGSRNRQFWENCLFVTNDLDRESSNKTVLMGAKMNLSHISFSGSGQRSFRILSSGLYFVFKVAIAEDPDSQRYDVKNGNSIRNAFVFSAENSASTSIQNSKSDLLQNCPLISSLDGESMKISFSAGERPSGVFRNGFLTHS